MSPLRRLRQHRLAVVVIVGVAHILLAAQPAAGDISGSFTSTTTAAPCEPTVLPEAPPAPVRVTRRATSV